MRLTEPFYRRKIGEAQVQLVEQALDGLLLFHHPQIYYLAGFFHFPSERPIVLFVPRSGDPILFVPKLEEDYTQEAGWAPQIAVYEEYPGVVPVLQWLGDELDRRGYGQSRLAVESSLSLGAFAQLQSALLGVTWKTGCQIVSKMRLIKGPEEIALMRKAASYADWMLSEGVRLLRGGGRPTEIDLEQTMVSGLIRKMQHELDPVIAVPGLAGAIVPSGPRSAFPHGLPTGRRIAPGENLILSVACFVGGYFAESERTFLLGEPSREQCFRYETDRQAQEIGVQALRAGTRCAEANRRCLGVIREAGLGQFILHRQGHGIGVQNHEPPWIEDGDETILAPGMTVSCEPGIYCPGQGGYRVSDSVLVTVDGPDRLTQFPRDLESIVIGI